MSKSARVERSSGNVFADLGLVNAEEHLAKAKIAHAIAETIRKRRMTQRQAGEILGIPQPKVSDLVRGKLEKLTTDRLLRYARKLDYDVLITLTPKAKTRRNAKMRVKVPA